MEKKFETLKNGHSGKPLHALRDHVSYIFGDDIDVELKCAPMDLNRWQAIASGVDTGFSAWIEYRGLDSMEKVKTWAKKISMMTVDQARNFVKKGE
jgi:hypothetical protein